MSLVSLTWKCRNWYNARVPTFFWLVKVQKVAPCCVLAFLGLEEIQSLVPRWCCSAFWASQRLCSSYYLATVNTKEGIMFVFQRLLWLNEYTKWHHAHVPALFWLTGRRSTFQVFECSFGETNFLNSVLTSNDDFWLPWGEGHKSLESLSWFAYLKKQKKTASRSLANEKRKDGTTFVVWCLFGWLTTQSSGFQRQLQGASLLSRLPRIEDF